MERSYNIFLGFIAGCATTICVLYFMQNNSLKNNKNLNNNQDNYLIKEVLDVIIVNVVKNNNTQEEETKKMLLEDINMNDKFLNEKEIDKVFLNNNELVFTDEDSEILDDSINYKHDKSNNENFNKYCLLKYFSFA